MAISREDAIKKELKVAEESQRVVDTHVVFIDGNGDDVTVEEIYADDTEIIEAHLSNYQYCADYHKYIAEQLEKLQKIEDVLEHRSGYALEILNAIQRIEQIVKEV